MRELQIVKAVEQYGRLAQEFGQAGVLAWELGQPVRLRMMVGRPADADASACIDWVE